LNGFI